MGSKICLSATCRRCKGMVRHTQVLKVAPFTSGFPAESRLLVRFGWQRPYCCRLSAHQLSSSVSAAKLCPPRWPSSTLELAELTVVFVPEMLPTRLAGTGAGNPSFLCLDLHAVESQDRFLPGEEQILCSGVYTSMGHWVLWK